jgi:hypothetical protein
VGKIPVKLNDNVIDKNYTSLLQTCQPRPKPYIFVPNKIRVPWKYPVSLWAMYGYAYEGDSEELLNDCFDHDFTRNNFLKDMKTEEDLERLRVLMRSKYRHM